MIVQHVFVSMYELLLNHRAVDHTIYSMGNLAVFLDYYVPRKKIWENMRQQMEALLIRRDYNELLFMIAGELYYIARKNGLGENLEHRFKNIQKLYLKKKLFHFDLLLDDHDFPVWFREYIPFLECKHPVMFYLLVFKRMKQTGILAEVEALGGIAKVKSFAQNVLFDHTTNHLFEPNDKWKKVLEVVNAIDERNVTQLLKAVS